MDALQMNVVLLRIGIDTGSGGIHGPLFEDGTFEYIPIPDGQAVDERTYGNTVGRHGRKLIEYFPASMRGRMADQPMHVDPEFESFTYGDPTSPKAGLRNLKPGDLLVFYCGLQGWGFAADPALYLMGFFEVERAGRGTDFSDSELKRLFSRNFHVRHRRVFARQKASLVLVKGTAASRLLERPIRISVLGKDRAGNPLHVLSPTMRQVFGDFGGHVSIQRSPPRWISPDFIAKSADFVRSLGHDSDPSAFLRVAPLQPQERKIVRLSTGLTAMDEPNVYFVHLRRPKNAADLRDDPFYEFGSFGCTTCHSRNLMHPRRASKLQGARLAFVQGGTLGSRLVFLTPPVTVKTWKRNCEVRWTPIRMPFKYHNAPILVSNDGQSDFPLVKQFAMQADGGTLDDGRTPEARFCSKIRSLAEPLNPKLASHVVEVYENNLAKAPQAAIASTYDETLSKPPPSPDRDRKATYQRFIAQRQAEVQDSRIALRADEAKTGTRSPPRCGGSGRRRPSWGKRKRHS